MTRELRIEVRPAGSAGAAQVSVSGSGQPAQQFFQRDLPTRVDVEMLGSLRRGEAKANDVEQLSTAVSQWLLGADLLQILRHLVQNGDPLRVIFSVDQSIEERLGDLPVELLRTDAVAEHLVVHPRVDSLVRLLPKVVAGPVNDAALNWPMRVLMVRSNPLDLGGRVPPAQALRQDIVAQATAKFGAGGVEVDLLSREAGSQGPPTWEEFIKVAKGRYDLLVYLGHGDVERLHEDLPPLSQLQFETADGQDHEPVTARQLAALLRQFPIPVVILAGCLTAANPGNGNQGPDMAVSSQGNQGVAQALVNSESGVTLAVGMQSMIDGTDIALFLREFFSGLFGTNGGDTVGNVERSVRGARQGLFQRHPHPPTWASPVVFSNLMPEPIFKYLGDARVFVPTPDMSKALDIRRLLWSMLAEMPPGNRLSSLQAALDSNRAAIVAEVVGRAALLLPELIDAKPGTTVHVPVTVEGVWSLTMLQARVVASTGLQVVTVRRTAALSSAGYQLLVDNGGNPGLFQIQLQLGAIRPATMPTGVWLELELTTDAAASGVCSVSLEVLATDATQLFWAGHNAVIVQM